MWKGKHRSLAGELYGRMLRGETRQGLKQINVLQAVFLTLQQLLPVLRTRHVVIGTREVPSQSILFERCKNSSFGLFPTSLGVSKVSSPAVLPATFSGEIPFMLPWEESCVGTLMCGRGNKNYSINYPPPPFTGLKVNSIMGFSLSTTVLSSTLQRKRLSPGFISVLPDEH